MIPSSQFNEIEWLNNYLGQAEIINRDQIQSILNFAFIWNLFEGLMCKSDANIETFHKVVDELSESGKLVIDIYSHNLAYFKNRYITINGTNELFEKLKFRSRVDEELVKNVLEGVVVEDKKILLALIIIVYRLRNNLFHGLKSLYSMKEQIDNFRNANQILIKLLEPYRLTS